MMKPLVTNIARNSSAISQGRESMRAAPASGKLRTVETSSTPAMERAAKRSHTQPQKK